MTKSLQSYSTSDSQTYSKEHEIFNEIEIVRQCIQTQNRRWPFSISTCSSLVTAWKQMPQNTLRWQKHELSTMNCSKKHLKLSCRAFIFIKAYILIVVGFALITNITLICDSNLVSSHNMLRPKVKNLSAWPRICRKKSMDPHNIVWINRNTKFVPQSWCIKYMTTPFQIERVWLINTVNSVIYRCIAVLKTPCIESILKFYLLTG